MSSIRKPRLAPIVAAYEYFKLYGASHCVKYQLAIRADGQLTERRHSDRPANETRSSSGWTRPTRIKYVGESLETWVTRMERLGFAPSSGKRPGAIPIDAAKEDNWDRTVARRRREETAC